MLKPAEEYVDAATRVRRRMNATAIRVVIDNPEATDAEQAAMVREIEDREWVDYEALVRRARQRATDAAEEGWQIIGVA